MLYPKKIRFVYFSKKFKSKESFILFLPFLFLYTLIILLFKKSYYVGDEPRYLMFAHNILNGFYSPPPPDINLWNGPGYPVILSIFIKFSASVWVILFFNAVVIYLSLILTYKSLNYFLDDKKAFIYTGILGLYYPMYRMLPKILTESLTWFLVSLIVYFGIKIYYERKHSYLNTFWLGFSIFYLMITKVIFGYVVPILLILLLFWYFFTFRGYIRKYIVALILSLLLSLPYLYYTYTLTGKYYYWSNAGGISLYLMSTPYESEDGRFIPPKELIQSPLHHREADSILNLPGLQMDEALKKVAVKNIKNHPVKFLKNWISNLYRLFIAGPFLDEPKNIIYTIPNSFIIFFILWSFTDLRKNIKKIPFPLYFLLLFFLIYLGGNSLLTAKSRMFYISLPFWVIWIAVIRHLNKDKAKQKTTDIS